MDLLTKSEWWQKAVVATDRSEIPPVTEDAPQAGYFAVRLHSRGPFTPCRIWLDPETRTPRAHIGGTLIDPKAPTPMGTVWLWIANHPISQDDYEDLVRETVVHLQTEIDNLERDLI